MKRWIYYSCFLWSVRDFLYSARLRPTQAAFGPPSTPNISIPMMLILVFYGQWVLCQFAQISFLLRIMPIHEGMFNSELSQSHCSWLFDWFLHYFVCLWPLIFLLFFFRPPKIMCWLDIGALSQSLAKTVGLDPHFLFS